MFASSSSGGGRRVFGSYKDALVSSAFAKIAINSIRHASIKLTLVIRTKLAAAILGGGLFGGNVLPVQYCPCGLERQLLACCIQRRCHFVTFLEDRLL